MLEFSDAPYQFFEAKPSRPLIWLGRTLNRHFVVPGSNHLIKELIVEGDTESPRKAIKNGDRILFVINHPSHSDPQVVTEVHRQLGIPSCFMAAYDVFLRSHFAAWFMQKLGHFSIDREGSDRKAMATAIKILTKGEYALNIFPEGNVYLTNDRVTPFLDGTAFIALKAQKALKDARVKIIPISLKYTHLTLPRETVTQRLRKLGQDSGHSYSPGIDPLGAVIGLGTHLISDFLKSHGFDREIGSDEENLYEELSAFTLFLVTDLEKSLELPTQDDAPLVARIRKIRSTLHQIKTDGSTPSRDDVDQLADKAILAFRINGYLTPYLTENPTVDRLEETVERIAEDFYSKAMPRTGPRKAYAHLHPPLDVAEYLENADGKLRNAVSALTADMESRVQEGITRLSEENTTPGGTLIEAL